MELDKPAVIRVLASLLAGELKSMRGEETGHLDVCDMGADTRIRPPAAQEDDDAWANSLQVDSIELVGLATRTNEWFQLADSGLEDYLLRFNTLGEWADLIAHARREGYRDIQVKSSGTSGQAKNCPYHWRPLEQEMAGWQQLLPGQLSCPPRRIVLLCPAHHLYGFLFGALLPSLWQIPVVTGFKAFSCVHNRRLRDGDIVVGFPLIWDQIAARGGPFTATILGLCSTGPSRPETLTKLRRQGLTGWVEIYGATETGGVGYRHHSDDAFTLLPHWQRHSDTHLIEPDSGQTAALQDAAQWYGKRQFKPSGRRDGAVQVSGVNVDPALIARRLETLEEVAHASVRLMNPDEGQRLKAYIVPSTRNSDTADLERQLRRWCATELTAPQIPKHFSFGRQLPTNALGKPSDWDMASGISGLAQSQPLEANIR